MTDIIVIESDRLGFSITLNGEVKEACVDHSDVVNFVKNELDHDMIVIWKR